jgi:hypothetical protein
MVFLLKGDIPQNAGKILLGEADDPIASLPFESSGPKPLVHFVRTGAFDLSDKVADEYNRLKLENQVDMGFSAVDTLEMDALDLGAVFLDEGMKRGFDIGGNERPVIEAVPVHMEEYLAEGVT